MATLWHPFITAFKSLHCRCGHPPTTSHQLIHPPSHSLHATVRSTVFANASIGPENSLSNYISCSFKDKPVLQRSPHVMHAPYNLVHVLPQHPSQDCAPVNPLSHDCPLPPRHCPHTIDNTPRHSDSYTRLNATCPCPFLSLSLILSVLLLPSSSALFYPIPLCLQAMVSFSPSLSLSLSLSL